MVIHPGVLLNPRGVPSPELDAERDLFERARVLGRPPLAISERLRHLGWLGHRIASSRRRVRLVIPLHDDLYGQPASVRAAVATCWPRTAAAPRVVAMPEGADADLPAWAVRLGFVEALIRHEPALAGDSNVVHVDPIWASAPAHVVSTAHDSFAKLGVRLHTHAGSLVGLTLADAVDLAHVLRCSPASPVCRPPGDWPGGDDQDAPF